MFMKICKAVSQLRTNNLQKKMLGNMENIIEGRNLENGNESQITVWTKIKTIVTMLVFNILLPTLDIYSDLSLIIKLYIGTPCDHCEVVNHPKFATALLIPFLLNYTLSFITWYNLNENSEQKKHTFIFPLLNIYPQYGRILIINYL